MSAYDVLFKLDVIQDKLDWQDDVDAALRRIEKEEKWKSNLALVGTVAGGFINPAFAIIGNVVGREATDLAMNSEDLDIDAPKYNISEHMAAVDEIEKTVDDLDRQDWAKSAKAAVGTLMLAGLGDMVAEQGVFGALGNKDLWTTWRGNPTAIQQGIWNRKFLKSAVDTGINAV